MAALDYQGHGESGGSRSNYDLKTGVLAIAQDCSRLLDAIEKLDIYRTHIDSSQIGITGHSLGGMVAIMNAALDSRFSATVSWAGVVNASSLGQYNPANLINKNQPKNLLIIHHVNDGSVDYEGNALLAKDLTGCEVVTITRSLPISAHYLIADEIIVETINWFEIHFFGSEIINGPITQSWALILLLNIFTFIGYTTTILSVMIFTFKFFFKKNEAVNKEHKEEETSQESSKIKQFSFFIIFYFSFFGVWFLTSQILDWVIFWIVPCS